jgi:hypothetical protein
LVTRSVAAIANVLLLLHLRNVVISHTRTIDDVHWTENGFIELNLDFRLIATGMRSIQRSVRLAAGRLRGPEGHEF